MANTTNLNLVKPAGTDHALVSDINGNMDLIDAFAGSTNTAIANKLDPNISASTTNKDLLTLAPGAYRFGSSCSNKPTNGNGYITIYERDSSTARQATVIMDSGEVYVNVMVSGSWGGWKELAQEKTNTASGTTSASGNLSLGLAASAGRVTSAYIASGYIAIPFVTSSTWYVHVMDNSAVAQASKSVTVEYTYV